MAIEETPYWPLAGFETMAERWTQESNVRSAYEPVKERAHYAASIAGVHVRAKRASHLHSGYK